jgi:hypothetical protein
MAYATACSSAGRRGDLQAEPPGGVSAETADPGLGRSRGGPTTKIHLACKCQPAFVNGVLAVTASTRRSRDLHRRDIR